MAECFCDAEVDCNVLDIVSSLMCAAELADAVKDLPYNFRVS